MSKNLSFSIQAWSAWSSSKRVRSDWLNWSKNEDFVTSEEKQDFSKIPAMKRRRMSSLSKMAIATSLDCLEQAKLSSISNIDEYPRCVFTSQHGELNRTMKILDSLVDGDDVSPTDFSLSVHNTASGLFSIQTKNQQPITSIAAGEDSFGFALIEACVQLHRNPTKSVLLVYFDEPIDNVLTNNSSYFNHREPESIALLLSAGKEISFSLDDAGAFTELSKKARIIEQNENYYNSLAQYFIYFYLSNNKLAEQQTTNHLWQWWRK